MIADLALALPFAAKVTLKGNSAVYIAFLIAALAAAAPCALLWKSLFKGPDAERTNRLWSAVFFVLGLMLVMAGMFVFWIFGTYGKPAAIVHGIGVGFIIAMLLVGTYEVGGMFKGQAAFFNTFTILVVAAALAILVGINYLGIQKGKKFDFNKKKLQSLDSATVNKLKALTDPVHVLVFVTKQERNQVPQIKEFFEKYQVVNRSMFKVRFSNPLNDLDLAGCFGVKQNKAGKLSAQVLIYRGKCVKDGKDGGLKFVGKKLNITKLTEEHITNRMIRVSRTKAKTVCFLRGRSQPKTDGKPTANGFHFLKKGLEDKGFKILTISLLDKDDVPKDCSILINAAPETIFLRQGSEHMAKLSDQEVDKVERYIDKGGKMLLFLEPRLQTGLAPMLKTKFGIGWKPGLTLEFRKNAGRPEVFFADNFDKRHIITKGFQEAGKRAFFYFASALEKSSSVAGVTLTTLVKTDERKFRAFRRDPKTGAVKPTTLKCCSFYIPKPFGMRFNFLRRQYVNVKARLMARRAATGLVERIMPDAKRQVLHLAMAAAKKSAKAGKETRVVVFADTFLGTNKGATFQGRTNITLLLNSVAWLAHEKDLVHLPPKNRKLKKVALTAVSRATIQYTTRYAMPMFFFFIILLVMAIRKQQ